MAGCSAGWGLGPSRNQGTDLPLQTDSLMENPLASLLGMGWLGHHKKVTSHLCGATMGIS